MTLARSRMAGHCQAALLISVILLQMSSAQAAEIVRSPDGKVVVSIELQEGRPWWSVTFDGQTFLRNGLLGVETGPTTFSKTYTLLGADSATSDTTWNAVWGNLSQIRDHYNELTVKLREVKTPGRVLHLVLRAYDEGVALRYEFPSQPG